MPENDSDFDEFDISVEDEALFHSLTNQFDHNVSPPSAEVEVGVASPTLFSKAIISSPREAPGPSNPGTSLVPSRPGTEKEDNPERERKPNNVARAEERNRSEETTEEEADRLAMAKDSRPPIERFRTKPKKTLSVSDLTSGQWCELQYEYTLTQLPFGRRVKTKAMKGGTKVHEKLERQVHMPVKVTVTKHEDGFGLRLWNIVQGLRTLREINLTRELEVWGLVDGNIVNGVIDHLQVDYVEPKDAGGDAAQPHITQHFSSSQSTTKGGERRILLTDVKTTRLKPFGKGLPGGSALVQNRLQLYLYYNFICDMADGNLDLLDIFQRYSMDPDAVFSDAYLAQVAEVHPEIFDEMMPDSSVASKAASSATDSHVKYRTLREMIPLYQDEMRKAFPRGSRDIVPQATIEYRNRGSGEIVGARTLDLDSAEIQPHLDKYMEWWYGKRPAEGVPIEEAYKCGICDFAESCTWRESMDQEILARARAKLEAKMAQ
ncbi:Exonuclease V [Zalerion maritima]|uniref:Exonuclease V n=1 Tax=Zalerion maritima TaxID=339359 RepID=A0AAD5RSH9_9PEZI|nr:Exonuclease V [Zalerion maritima]